MAEQTFKIISADQVVFIIRADQRTVLPSGETSVDLTQIDPPGAGVDSFNARVGAVLPLPGDYTAADVGATTPAQVDAAIAEALSAEPAKPLAAVLAAGNETGPVAVIVSTGGLVVGETDLLLDPGSAADRVVIDGLRWPGSDGAAGQFLRTNGAGTLGFEAVPPDPPDSFSTITGQPGDNANLAAALDLKAPLASPALTGAPTAPTAAPLTGGDRVATNDYADAAVAAEAALRAAGDAALADDIANLPPASFAELTGDPGDNGALDAALSAKANLTSPGFMGVPEAPTAGVGTNTTQIATTAFVLGQIAATPAPTWAAVLASGSASGASDAVMSSAAVALRGDDAASGGGLTVRGGNASAGNGGAVDVSGGSSTGASAGSSVTIRPGTVVTGARGRVLITHPGPNTDRVLELSSTGTNGAATQVFVSAVTPGGAVTANAGDVCIVDGGTRGDILVKDTGNGTATSWRGMPAVYTASGVTQQPRVWVGTASINATGAFTADISSAGFAAVTCVQATVQRNTTTPILVPFVIVRTISTTSVVGQCANGVTLIALGDTVALSTNGAPTTTVHLLVFGT